MSGGQLGMQPGAVGAPPGSGSFFQSPKWLECPSPVPPRERWTGLWVGVRRGLPPPGFMQQGALCHQATLPQLSPR